MSTEHADLVIANWVVDAVIEEHPGHHFEACGGPIVVEWSSRGGATEAGTDFISVDAAITCPHLPEPVEFEQSDWTDSVYSLSDWYGDDVMAKDRPVRLAPTMEESR